MEDQNKGDYYYPFGLTMSGISDRALKFGKVNKYRFQKQELQSDEFSNHSGLDMYEFKYRFDDPQIGMFWSIDPLADKYVYNSTYAFSEDKVTNGVELEGLEAFGINQTNAAATASLTNPNLHTEKEFNQIAAGEAKGQAETAVAAAPLILTTLTWGVAGPEAATAVGLTSLTGVPMTPSPQAFAEGAAPDALALAPTVIDNLAPAATDAANAGSTTLFRAVSSVEAADIGQNGFQLKRGTYDAGKLFSTTPEDAVQYGKNNFGLDQQPNTIVKTQFSSDVMKTTTIGEMDGMKAVSIPVEHLQKATNTSGLNYSTPPTNPYNKPLSWNGK